MKSFLRFLSRNKIYALIEAVGLAVSLAFVVMVGSYAYEQYKIVKENPDRKDIYAFGMPDFLGLTYGFPDAMKERVPEIEEVSCMIMTMERLQAGDSWVDAMILGTDKNFYDMFPYYGFVSGSPELLDAHGNAIVSETFASKYSLKEGEVLKISDNEYVIAGIAKDFKTTLVPYYDIILSDKCPLFNSLPLFNMFSDIVTLAKVQPGTDRQVLYDKAENVCKEVYEGYGEAYFEKLSMPRLDEIYFWDGQTSFNHGDRRTLRILTVVGLLLLICAIFNYINLNFALVGKRAKEMATRRLVGESKAGVIWRYILEAVLFTAVCLAFAILLAKAFTPTVNSLIGDPAVPIRIQFGPVYILGFMLLVLLVGVISGLLPALFASRYQPIDIVRGTFRTSSKMVFSKIFIVIQCAFSVFLISMAIVMQAQYRKSINRPANFDSADKFYLRTSGTGEEKEVLADALRELPCIKRVGLVQGVPGSTAYGQYSKTVDDKEILYKVCYVDSTAFDMLNLRIVKDYGAPLYNSVWFSQSAFDASGFTDERHPIDTLKDRGYGFENLAGVFMDPPVSTSNQGEKDNLIISVRPEAGSYHDLLIETEGDHAEARKAIMKVFDDKNESGMNEAYIATYIDDIYKNALKPARDNMRLMEIFMFLSIMISLMGLMAMSAYFADERSLDIAIRKVFGATVDSELSKNVSDYIVMVLVACVIGVPIAVWASRMYLEAFIDRISGYAWIFILAIVLTMVMAFLSVFWQTLRAAQTNPADKLR
jgi:putative ABC transport system permease protein